MRTPPPCCATPLLHTPHMHACKAQLYLYLPLPLPALSFILYHHHHPAHTPAFSHIASLHRGFPFLPHHHCTAPPPAAGGSQLSAPAASLLSPPFSFMPPYCTTAHLFTSFLRTSSLSTYFLPLLFHGMPSLLPLSLSFLFLYTLYFCHLSSLASAFSWHAFLPALSSTFSLPTTSLSSSDHAIVA